jgi:hypothetical protein
MFSPIPESFVDLLQNSESVPHQNKAFKDLQDAIDNESTSIIANQFLDHINNRLKDITENVSYGFYRNDDPLQQEEYVCVAIRETDFDSSTHFIKAYSKIISIYHEQNASKHVDTSVFIGHGTMSISSKSIASFVQAFFSEPFALTNKFAALNKARADANLLSIIPNDVFFTHVSRYFPTNSIDLPAEDRKEEQLCTLL